MQFQLPPQRGFDPSSLIGPVVFAALIWSGAFGWIFNLFGSLIFIAFLIPIVGGPIFQWYVSNNLLEGSCPDCGGPIQLMKQQTNIQCPSCGATMSSELSDSGVFMREANKARTDGVVDVEVEVLTDD